MDVRVSFVVFAASDRLVVIVIRLDMWPPSLEVHHRLGRPCPLVGAQRRLVESRRSGVGRLGLLGLELGEEVVETPHFRVVENGRLSDLEPVALRRAASLSRDGVVALEERRRGEAEIQPRSRARCTINRATADRRCWVAGESKLIVKESLARCRARPRLCEETTDMVATAAGWRARGVDRSTKDWPASPEAAAWLWWWLGWGASSWVWRRRGEATWWTSEG